MKSDPNNRRELVEISDENSPLPRPQSDGDLLLPAEVPRTVPTFAPHEEDKFIRNNIAR